MYTYIYIRIYIYIYNNLLDFENYFSVKYRFVKENCVENIHTRIHSPLLKDN